MYPLGVPDSLTSRLGLNTQAYAIQLVSVGTPMTPISFNLALVPNTWYDSIWYQALSYQALRTKYLVPSTFVPSTWYQVPGTKYFRTKYFRTKYLVPSIWYPPVCA